jgi:hypothetical protein
LNAVKERLNANVELWCGCVLGWLWFCSLSLPPPSGMPIRSRDYAVYESISLLKDRFRQYCRPGETQYARTTSVVPQAKAYGCDDLTGTVVSTRALQESGASSLHPQLVHSTVEPMIVVF